MISMLEKINSSLAMISGINILDFRTTLVLALHIRKYDIFQPGVLVYIAVLFELRTERSITSSWYIPCTQIRVRIFEQRRCIS